MVAMAVSTQKVLITPGVGTIMGGYDMADANPRRAQSTHTDLWARCLILWDNGSPNINVTADILLFPRSMNAAIRAGLTNLGFATSDIALTATHTHHGPALVDTLDPVISYNAAPADVTAITEVSSALTAQIIQLVKTTLASPRTTCTLDYQVAKENFAYNREGVAAVETDVPILTARDLTGKVVAILFGYGCHAVSADHNDFLFDGDYPGNAVAAVESSTGAFAQFLQGAAGDQDPLGTHGWDAVAALGASLSQIVIKAVNTPGRPLSGPIQTKYRNVQLPLDLSNAAANLATVGQDFAQRAQNNAGTATARFADAMLAQLASRTFATMVPLPLQVWSVQGNPLLKIVFSGGELVSGYAMAARAKLGGSHGVWVNGYSNEVPAYIPTDDILFPGNRGAVGYYACGFTPDCPGIGGASMTYYGWLAHFLGREPGSDTNGVEQVLLANLYAMLGTN
jgi:neutral ceramidase